MYSDIKTQRILYAFYERNNATTLSEAISMMDSVFEPPFQGFK